MRNEISVSHVGLDHHRRFGRVTARDAQNRVVWRDRLEYRDRAALRQKLAQWPQGLPVVLEGTFGWGWMSDELLAAKLEPHLANSGKLAGWRKARGLAKNNRLDADLLSEVWLERERWWEVWLAPPEVRRQREWMRYRMGLVRTQTALKNKTHAILHGHGVWHEYTDLFGVQGRRFLNLLVAGQEGNLPESTRRVLKGELQLLDALRRQIAGATRLLRRELTGSQAGQWLRTLPGISWILSHTILAEVGRFDRFPSAGHLASYSLLAPRACDSGDEDGGTPIGRHVGKIGRRTLKWAWMEAAHTAVRSSPRMRALYDRRTDGGQRDKNRGVILVAHQLCRIGYLLEKKQMAYLENPPAGPTGQRRSVSRSVMG